VYQRFPDADLRLFYREQENRMRSFGMEVIQFADVFCQLHDLLKPAKQGTNHINRNPSCLPSGMLDPCMSALQAI
jgi:hypothetical protein